MKQQRELAPQEKLNLLMKSKWCTTDISKYLSVSRGTAGQIKRRFPVVDIGYGGTYVLADDVLKGVLKTNRLAEIEIITKCLSTRNA